MYAWYISGQSAAAWSAAIAAAVALTTQAVSALRKRKKEKVEINEALDRAPEVRHQLELGNVGEAVKHLNFIIESQAAHIKAQDERQKTCDERLTAQDRQLAAQENQIDTLQRENAELRQQIADLRRTYGRIIAQLRGEKE